MEVKSLLIPLFGQVEYKRYLSLVNRVLKLTVEKQRLMNIFNPLHMMMYLLLETVLLRFLQKAVVHMHQRLKMLGKWENWLATIYMHIYKVKRWNYLLQSIQVHLLVLVVKMVLLKWEELNTT